MCVYKLQLNGILLNHYKSYPFYMKQSHWFQTRNSEKKYISLKTKYYDEDLQGEMARGRLNALAQQRKRLSSRTGYCGRRQEPDIVVSGSHDKKVN